MNAVEIEQAISELAEKPFDRQELSFQSGRPLICGSMIIARAYLPFQFSGFAVHR